MIDVHTHILPGVDDGATSVTESIEILRELEDAGVTDVIVTPHFMVESIYTSLRDKNEALMRKLQHDVRVAGVNVKLHIGNEIYIDKTILKLVSSGVVATLGGASKYLLVELPMTGEYENTEDILVELMAAGYKVVLAHPERYVTVQKDFGLVARLYDAGVLLQCNIGSFDRQYGKKAEKIACRLAKDKKIFVLGSDIHYPKGEGWMDESMKKLRKYYTAAELNKILNDNPAKILAE